jgi:hypothetical protein
MGSVLSPVGSQPPRVYWMRRIFVLGLPLVLIVIIAVSCGGGSKSPSASSGGGPSSGSTTTSGSNGACAPGELAAALSTSATTYQVGQRPAFTATITNTSTLPCQLTTSPSNETWKVLSGAAHWWTTAGCPKSTASSTKTLNAGASRKVSITWDGHRLEPGCTAGEAALPGTYHLKAILDGVSAQQVTFHFTKNTQ